jgi:hypothetical protein
MKIHPVGDDLLHADRGTVSQTNMKKLIVAFRNFATAHKNRPETIASQLLLLQFFWGGVDENQEEMGGACNIYGRNENSHRVLIQSNHSGVCGVRGE